MNDNHDTSGTPFWIVIFSQTFGPGRTRDLVGLQLPETLKNKVLCRQSRDLNGSSEGHHRNSEMSWKEESFRVRRRRDRPQGLSPSDTPRTVSVT